MSIRIRESEVSKRYSARRFASNVFPTPVGPRKIKEPSGRFGDEIPTRERLIAEEMRFTASSWPIKP
jgi:hypothetical protein